MNSRPRSQAFRVIRPLPPASPWASDPVPNEEPLGLDVNYVEAVGTPTEIEAASQNS